jgi:hypothetical protein
MYSKVGCNVCERGMKGIRKAGVRHAKRGQYIIDDVLTEKKTKMFARLVLFCLLYYSTVCASTGKSVFW